MSVTQVSPGNAASTPQNDNSVKARNEAALGKQDFLTLLVAQLQNQDPMNPDEPTEFTAQLAQYSSLEQLFNLNDSMADMAQAVKNSDQLATLGTIGKDVVYFDSKLNYSGGGAEIGYKLDSPASAVKVFIKQNGATIKVIEGEGLDKGNHFLTWDGTTQTGQAAPQGEYEIVVSAVSGNGETVAAAPLIKSEVTGIDLSGEGGGTLETAAGSTSYAEILGIYDKDSRAGSQQTASRQEDKQDLVENAVENAVDNTLEDADDNESSNTADNNTEDNAISG